jgi:hypothetical protein
MTKLEILECALIGWAALEEYGAKLLRPELDNDSPNDEKIFF